MLRQLQKYLMDSRYIRYHSSESIRPRHIPTKIGAPTPAKIGEACVHLIDVQSFCWDIEMMENILS